MTTYNIPLKISDIINQSLMSVWKVHLLKTPNMNLLICGENHTSEIKLWKETNWISETVELMENTGHFSQDIWNVIAEQKVKPAKQLCIEEWFGNKKLRSIQGNLLVWDMVKQPEAGNPLWLDYCFE